MAQAQPNSVASAQASQHVIPPFLKENFKAVRLMVYDILEAQPLDDFDRADRDTVVTSTQEEFEIFADFGVTRKSLRLTCKKIKDEWTGNFSARPPSVSTRCALLNGLKPSC